MADSLLLKGERSISKHTGTEMTHVQGTSGGVSRFPRWYDRGGSIQYINCAIFNVKVAGNQLVKLVVPVTKDTEVTIHHDGEGNFTFSGYRYISRAAVFPEISCAPADMITEYQFPKISGGAVLTRTLGKLPSAPKKEEAPKKATSKFEVKVDTKTDKKEFKKNLMTD